MRLTLHLAVLTVRDLSRNRWAFLYAGFFLAVTIGLFCLQAHSAKVAVSLMSITLFLIPLVSALFGSMYLYNSREFVELVLTQPVSRRAVYVGLLLGLASTLSAGFAAGVGIPSLLMGERTLDQLTSLALLVGVGCSLTVIFLAISFLLAIQFDDRGKGLAAVLGVWLLSALVYDGLVLLVVMAFSDYPLEMPLLFASLANPIDLARVTLLVKTDWAALMGYTGAVFNRFFGTGVGVTVAILSLIGWAATPVLLGMRRFRFKDM